MNFQLCLITFFVFLNSLIVRATVITKHFGKYAPYLGRVYGRWRFYTLKCLQDIKCNAKRVFILSIAILDVEDFAETQ